MKRMLPLPTGLVALVALVAAPAFAQMTMDMSVRYDKATEKTLTGAVENVFQVPGDNAMSGTHLVVKTKDGEIHVHAGPASFLASKKVAFKKGDRIEVVGSLIKGEGFQAILARQIKRGNQVITLRDAAGVPTWSGRAGSGEVAGGK
jgi:hypothetical protein